MNISYKIFTTHDHARLRCAIWDNVENPIGVVQIIHGIFDNMSTYDKLAKCLNRNGYIVFGIDTVLNKIPRTFERAVAQESDIMQHLANKYHLPIFLIGYGYGGFVAQSLSRRSNTHITAVCLIKSIMYNRWIVRVAHAFARIGAKICGSNTNINIINLFNRYHCGRVQKSPLCTYGFCASLFDGLIKLDTESGYDNPVLIISNATERDATTAQFSRALYNAYHNNDLINTTMLIYPDMQNKLLMEMNCGRIQDDILSFFNDSYAQHHSDISANLNGTILSKSDGAN